MSNQKNPIKKKFNWKEWYQKQKRENLYELRKNWRRNQYICLLRKKLWLIQQLGGKCSKCGYNKVLSALEFHEVNERHGGKWRSVRLFSYIRLKRMIQNNELILFCANCHREHHNPTTLDEAKKIVNSLI